MFYIIEDGLYGVRYFNREIHNSFKLCKANIDVKKLISEINKNDLNDTDLDNLKGFSSNEIELKLKLIGENTNDNHFLIY